MTPSTIAAPRVSVLMTAYNREAYIAESIESVLAQTFADFELIVVDDGSRDATVAIGRRYESDPRVRVVENAQNLGDYPNRNHAATLARGEFLKYHDSDDVMYPHCLQVIVGALAAEPLADFALSGNRDWPGGPCPMLLTPRLAYEREFLGTGLFQLGPASALFRTSFFHNVGGFDLAGAASDYLFWFKACARGRVLLCPGDLFYYRVHAGQEIANERSERDYLMARARAWAALNGPDCPLEGAALQQARRNFAFIVGREAMRDALNGRLSAALRRVQSCGLAPSDWLRYARPPRRIANAGTPSRTWGPPSMSGPMYR